MYACEKTHRCKGSLENEVSIRKNANKSRWSNTGVYEGWTLWKAEYDLEYDCYHDNVIARISLCPFCGVGLED